MYTAILNNNTITIDYSFLQVIITYPSNEEAEEEYIRR